MGILGLGTASRVGVRLRPRARGPLAAAVLASAILLVPVGATRPAHAGQPTVGETQPAAGEATQRGEAAAGRGASGHYLVSLAIEDATTPIDPGSRRGRARAQERARGAEAAIDALERAHGFKASARFRWALAGFAASLSPGQLRALRRDPLVARVALARQVGIAAQVVPSGIRRVQALPGAGPAAADIDADVAIIDTGIGPVGGGELNVAGGRNCSRDGEPANAWADVWITRHGTHVAGIVGARDNSLGVVGVAPGVRLWSLRVFGEDGYGDEATVVCALDWAVATHAADPGDRPAGSQPIEVANLSLVGPRQPGAEACGVADDPDIEHVAICSAVAAGITVVVAAGNAASNADQFAPAGYAQVVTVSALSDFDGRAGGLAAPTCAIDAFGREVDDEFARYSNFGADIDLIAPGSCILSTYPDGAGSSDDGRTQRMSGTSMAAPHVAGAAARYIAARPGATPSQVASRLRAAGRLDWTALSDPDWSGPTDGTGRPDRLLDTAALLAADPHLAVWPVPSTMVAGIGETVRRSRLELQRIGGYDGAVTLDVEGLAAETGTATVTPATPLTGLDGLSAILRLDLAPDGPDGETVLTIGAQGEGGDPNGEGSLELLVDHTRPEVSGPSVRVLPRRTFGSRGAWSRLAWSGDDTMGPIARFVLQRSLDGGPWSTIASGADLRRADRRLRPGRDYRFRVRAFDVAGNARTGTPLAARLVVRDSDSARLARSPGDWRTVAASGAVGGSLERSSTPGATISAAFDGQGVAVVAPLDPRGGSLRVRVDGGTWSTIDLGAAASARQVVHGVRLSPGAHTLEIAVVGGRVDVDAILVLR